MFNSGVITGPVLGQYCSSTVAVVVSLLQPYCSSTAAILHQQECHTTESHRCMVLSKQKQARCPLSPPPPPPGQKVQAQGGKPMLFSILVPLLDQYWASTGPVLDQYWGSTGPVLYQYWGQCCISTGASTGASTGPVLGSVLDQYWTSSGVSTVPVL